MSKNTRHVVPNSNGTWSNKKGGAERATSVHDTQAEAINVARQQSRNEGSELLIHGRDGQIRAKDSHGNDPRKIKG